jgi:hypothetical protein
MTKQYRGRGGRGMKARLEFSGSGTTVFSFSA